MEDLQAKGYDVTAPQFPLTSLADDVARLRQALGWQSTPSVVVGHSYGGQVMTALGADVANVVGLVYIAAFGLDEGESIAALGADTPPPPALANLIVDERGFGRLPEDDFVAHFAADVAPAHRRSNVSTTESTNEPRQPSRLEKKRNTHTGCPAGHARHRVCQGAL